MKFNKLINIGLRFNSFGCNSENIRGVLPKEHKKQTNRHFKDMRGGYRSIKESVQSPLDFDFTWCRTERHVIPHYYVTKIVTEKLRGDIAFI